MRIALLLRGHDAEMAQAHRDFHRSAGVDLVLDGSRVAYGLGADWVIESEPNEFWWPRGGSLKEVLESIPLATAASRHSCATSFLLWTPTAPSRTG